MKIGITKFIQNTANDETRLSPGLIDFSNYLNNIECVLFNFDFTVPRPVRTDKKSNFNSPLFSSYVCSYEFSLCFFFFLFYIFLSFLLVLLVFFFSHFSLFDFLFTSHRDSLHRLTLILALMQRPHLQHVNSQERQKS